MARAGLINALPKAELHIHIEGSLEPSLMLDLATRNNVSLPFSSREEVLAAYQFDQLQDFLNLYYQGMSVLRSRVDFRDLATAYLARAAADNVKHVEIFFDPQGHLPRGVAFDDVLGGLNDALDDAARNLGISGHLIMCFLRHLDEVDAERMLDLALAHKDRIIGIGLDSSELGHPPRKFKNVFRRARDQGFHLVAHAGEEGPPDYVWEAIEILGVDRIDHGNRALEDRELVLRIARDKIPLTVCPLSNLRLCVIDDMREHPIRRMLEAGLIATVNSDDPAYFGGYVNENFQALDTALDLTDDEVIALARNSFEAAFIAPDEKARALARLAEAAG
ncbi:MAG: adenosine deaminase [Alphaproteobacteria bacterium]|jgi:adenosine deaminase|nr:adenosine deaminase [Alphaproteobacteria bacterium]